MHKPDTDTQSRFGFVSIIGPTNAGKSTLLNRLVGSKVSIVSHKVQTTRTRITGIAIHENTEIAFIDTPGIFKPQNRLGKSMVASAWKAPQNANIVALLIDAQKPITPTVQNINERLLKQKTNFYLVLNKIDLVNKETLPPLSAYFAENPHCLKVYMISALKNDGVNDLLKALAAQMPIAEWLYDRDEITDMPVRLFAAEITREAAFRYLHQELPYALTVESETWQEKASSVNIGQVIYVSKPGHKAMVLGKGGANIKRIGSESRRQLQGILQKHVHLQLFVKLRPNWQDDPQRYKMWNLDF